MKYLIKGLLIFLVLILSAFILFYFWGGSGAFRSSEYYRLVKFHDRPSQRKDTFSVMTYNIGYLSGLDNNTPVRTTYAMNLANLDRAVSVIKDLSPDFIGFQEIDFASHRSYYLNQFDSIGLLGDYAMGAIAVNWDKNFVPFPYWPPSTYFGKILSGQAVLSRYPIVSNTVMILPKPASNAFYYNRFYLDRLVQTAGVELPDSVKLLIINVHFEAFDKKTREIDSDRLVDYLKTIPRETPYILIGDFNSRPPYRGVSLNDERTIRNIIASGLEPAVGENLYAADPGKYYTFNSGHPVEKIDYIFYNPSRISEVDAFVVKEMGEISDHWPMYMKFIIKN